MAARHGRIDGLVNNAGIGYGTAPRRGERTEDGHEPTWQVNFLSAFLLTEGLRGRMEGGRVVHMSSGVHSSGEVDLEQPDEPRYATPYAQSKIALVLLAREQGERWAASGPAVNACSPAGSPRRWAAPAAAGSRTAPTRRCGCSPLRAGGRLGRYFWQRREEEPNPQTEDAAARRRLVALAEAAVTA